MTRMYVNTKIRLQKALEAREAGQGTLEYIGMVVVAVILVVAVITVFNKYQFATKLGTQLDLFDKGLDGAGTGGGAPAGD